MHKYVINHFYCSLTLEGHNFQSTHPNCMKLVSSFSLGSPLHFSQLSPSQMSSFTSRNKPYKKVSPNLTSFTQNFHNLSFVIPNDLKFVSKFYRLNEYNFHLGHFSSRSPQHTQKSCSKSSNNAIYYFWLFKNNKPVAIFLFINFGRP